MKILHVCESYGGGVTSAINSYVLNTPQCDHYLFATVRSADSTGEEHNLIYKKTILAKRSLNAINELRGYYNEIEPDIVHVHSSFAGVVVRILPFIKTHKICYTPHAFSFLRQDKRFFTGIYYFVEKLLSFRTHAYIGCGKYESFLCKKLNHKIKNFNIVNVCNDVSIYKREKNNSKLSVCMVGRITKQKGFTIFANVAKQFHDIEFIWIGGGDKLSTEYLQNSGVRVTGWLSRTQVLTELSKSDLYFHTALWEGFPISILEAASLDIPVMAWSIPPFYFENMFVVSTIEEAVSIISAQKNGAIDPRLKFNKDFLNTNNTSKQQGELLYNAYLDILEMGLKN